MSSSKHLFEATVNLLTTKVSQGIIDAANKIAVITEEAPDKIRKEVELLQEEIYAEAERLSKKSNSQSGDNDSDIEKSSNDSPKEKIDRIRSKISELSLKVEK